MLRWLVSLSLRHAAAVVILAAVLTALGVRAVRSVPLDVFPEFAPPVVEIQTEAPGLSALEVESLVSVPLESALTGVAHVKTVRSKSVLGLSSVVLILEPGADLLDARQLVQERLARAAAGLPAVARPPVLLVPLAGRAVHARALDDPAAAPRRARRGQRGHLGST
jgi:Cu/Ag efflux pump CusA